jgi:hypothetical protein
VIARVWFGEAHFDFPYSDALAHLETANTLLLEGETRVPPEQSLDSHPLIVVLFGPIRLACGLAPSSGQPGELRREPTLCARAARRPACLIPLRELSLLVPQRPGAKAENTDDDQQTDDSDDGAHGDHLQSVVPHEDRTLTFVPPNSALLLSPLVDGAVRTDPYRPMTDGCRRAA